MNVKWIRNLNTCSKISQIPKNVNCKNMLKFRYACTFLLIIIGLGCVVNTEEGKCRRDIKIEKIDQGDPCESMLLFGILANAPQKNPISADEVTDHLQIIGRYYAFQCFELEEKLYACGKKSNILPVLQEPRGDIN